MINLLPPKAKEEILLERKKRVVLSNWILVLLFFVFLLSAMFLIKFYLQIQTTYLKAQLVTNKQILERNMNEEILNKINLFDSSFEELNAFYRQRIYISEVLAKISRLLPNTVYLTNFFVSPNLVLENNDDELNQLVGFNIYVAGFSPTREEVLQLKANMEKEEDFKEVFFPLTNWVKTTNIDFSLSFKVIKP
ncbi:hypothetical protein KKE19_01195 [Patescibacteria group bacterium]|nr:hypothetical protein [Patescibacteria group bacterium]MBU4368012.1 hypothetical protein [Patescibacteria group bacterium]MBU4462247.1 hypothetical protein [Patescibacteria group bacterium]MCG2699603.1 hypothetical protein [Candidatus Parcubacteria bacterium]